MIGGTSQPATIHLPSTVAYSSGIYSLPIERDQDPPANAGPVLKLPSYSDVEKENAINDKKGYGNPEYEATEIVVDLPSKD